MPTTVTDADVTTRTGGTGFERALVQRHVARTFCEFPITLGDPDDNPETWGFYHAQPPTKPGLFAERWVEIAALETALSEESTRASASATSTLISTLDDFFGAFEADRVDRGTYSPPYSHRVLFTQEVELKTADLPRRKPRAYIDRRTLEENDAD